MLLIDLLATPPRDVEKEEASVSVSTSEPADSTANSSDTKEESYVISENDFDLEPAEPPPSETLNPTDASATAPNED